MLELRRPHVFPSQIIRAFIRENKIIYTSQNRPILESQIQPSSLDLRLSDYCYEIKASCLPINDLVLTMLAELKAVRHRLSDVILKKDHIYIIPLIEHIDLPKDLELEALLNTKSSIGRLDIMVRTITDYCQRFDHIYSGYNGPLYVEVVPRSFDIKLKEALSLNQIRFVSKLTYPVKEDLDLHIDLTAGELIGYTPKNNINYLDLSLVNNYNIDDYWDPIILQDNYIDIEVDKFYIFHSLNDVSISPYYCGEMTSTIPSVMEARLHYAGFFDSSFGYNVPGTKAVMEIRCRDVPIRLQHNQFIGKIVLMPLTSKSDKPYGLSNHYQGQSGPRLSKYFKND